MGGAGLFFFFFFFFFFNILVLDMQEKNKMAQEGY